ncbi:MAG TPA: hypothetical protein PKD91_09240, partial [Bacteroidia bacterium]|nr:hypothetical protein [Bacteroidia bacterium]
MTVASNVIKRFLKIIAWFAVSILAIFIVILLLIRLPAVQNYAVDKVTSFVSNKTGTKVNIGNIYIGFPSTVIINNIFLDDLHSDTLLYANEIRAGVGLFGLIQGDISLGDITLTDVTVNLSRNNQDSTFNFNFLIEAFASKNKPESVDTSKKSTNISVDEIEMTNFHFTFKDDVSGMNLKTYIGELVLPVNDMDLDSLRFNAGDIEIKNTKIEFIQLFTTTTDTSSSSGALPEFFAQNISVVNSSFHMLNKDDSTGMYVKSGDFEISDVLCDLKSNVINASHIKLDSSSCMLFDRKITSQESAAKNKPSQDVDINIPFRIDVKKLEVNNSLFVVKGVDTISKPEFNPQNMSLAIRNFKINNIYHDRGYAGFSVLETKVSDRSGLAVSKFQGDFKITPSMFSVADFELKTNNSEINGIIRGRFKNLQMLIDEPGKSIVNVKLENSIINLEDLLLIRNDLSKQEIIAKNRNRKFVVNLFADGSLDNINVKDLSVQAGNTTFINISGQVSGLPDADKLFLNLNANRITTTASDIQSFISLPSSVNVPENITLSGSYVGSTTTFTYKVFAGTNRGLIVASGSFYNLDLPNPGYKLSAKLDQIELGYIFKSPDLGKINLVTNISGSGFKPESMIAGFSIKSDSVSVKNYTYENIDFFGSAKKGTISFKGNIADKNLDLNLQASLGILKEKEFYKAEINLKGLDLQELHFSDEELRASGTGLLDLKGNNMNNLSGNVEIKDVLIIKKGRNYPIESLAVLNINESGSKSVSLESSLLTAKFNGSVSITETGKELGLFFGKYFNADSISKSYVKGDQKFGFSVLVKNAPVISEVFVPGLESFIPGPIMGSFSSAESKLNVVVQFPQVIYKGIRVDSLNVKVDSDDNKLTVLTSLTRLSVGDIELTRTDFIAVASDNKIRAGIVVGTEDKVKLKMQALLTHGSEKGTIKLAIVDNKIVLNNQNWMIPPDNYVQLGGLYPDFHNFSFTHEL